MLQANSCNSCSQYGKRGNRTYVHSSSVTDYHLQGAGESENCKETQGHICIQYVYSSLMNMEFELFPYMVQFCTEGS